MKKISLGFTIRPTLSLKIVMFRQVETSLFNYYYNFKRDLFPYLQDKLQNPTIQKILRITTPYLGLHPTTGKGLSITVNTVQILSSIESFSQGNSSTIHCAYRCAVSVVGIVGVTSKNPWIVFLSNMDNIGRDAIDLASRLQKKEWNGVGEASLELANSSLYGMSLCSNNLEVTILSYSAQSLKSTYDAIQDFKKGEKLEGLGHLGFAAARGIQTKPLVQLCLRKRYLNKKYSFIRKQIAYAKKNFPDSDHPLKDLSKFINENTVSHEEPSIGRIVDLGANISGYGGHAVNRSQLVCRERIIDGKKTTLIEFKVTNTFRAHVQIRMDDLENIPSEEFSEFLNFQGFENKGFEIEKAPNTFIGKGENSEFSTKNQIAFGEAYVVKLHGVGKVVIGNEEEYRGMFNRVVVQLEEGQQFEGAELLLSLLNLSQALHPSSDEHMEKFKMLTLFRMIDPVTATKGDKKDLSLLTLSELKEEICKTSPSVSEKFERDLPNMYKQESIPGRFHWALAGRGFEANQSGVRCCLAAVGRNKPLSTTIDQLLSMFHLGMLSSGLRMNAGLIEGEFKGASLYPDVKHGSNGEVYVRAAPPPGNNSHTINDFLFQGHYVLLIPTPKNPNEAHVLDRIFRNYNDDQFGTSFGKVYENRDPFPQFISKLYADDGYRKLNEIVIPDRLPPKYLEECIVVAKNDEAKAGLIDALRARGMIEDRNGQEWFHGRPLDEAILTSVTKFDDDLLNRI